MDASIELSASLLAGLGLLFAGNKLVSDNLKVLMGRSFRELITKVSANPLAAALAGTLSGFVTWNSRTTTYIVASIVHSRLVSVRQALPIVFWANTGCALLVYAAVLPLKLLVLFLVGFSGICLFFDTPNRWKNSYGAIFGLSLLLMGLTLIKTGEIGLMTDSAFRLLDLLMKESPLVSFLMGWILAVAAQSHLSVILVALAMTESGLFSTLVPILMIILGAHVGNATNTYLFAWRFTGSARQVVMAQVLCTLSGVVLFLCGFAVGHQFDPPLLKRLADRMAVDIGTQAAAVTVVFNLVIPLLFSALLTPLLHLLERFWRPSDQDSLAHPAFLQAYMGKQPETAVLLAEQEQLRLFKWLSAYLDELRSERQHPGAPAPAVYHQAFVNLSERILEFLVEVLERDTSVETSERVLRLQNRQQMLVSIEEDLFSLFQLLQDRKNQGQQAKVRQLVQNIVESLDTILLTAVAAAETGDKQEREHLAVMTADRGTLMEKIRKNYLSTDEGLSPDDRSMILYVTRLFERIAWATGHYGNLLERAAQPQPVHSRDAQG